MTCTCKEVHWSDSSFSLGFGWLFRVPGGSFSPESSCEQSSPSKTQMSHCHKAAVSMLLVFVKVGGLSYLKTEAHRRGRTEQPRPCWAEDGWGCCSDSRGGLRGVWEEEAGRAWGRLENRCRRDSRAGKERGQAEEGWGRQAQWGRSACLWPLVSHRITTKTRWQDITQVLNVTPAKQWAPPLWLYPAVDRGSSLSPLICWPSTIFL